jgi:hypothetical protein
MSTPRKFTQQLDELVESYINLLAICYDALAEGVDQHRREYIRAGIAKFIPNSDENLTKVLDKLLVQNCDEASKSLERLVLKELNDPDKKKFAGEVIQAAINGRTYLAVSDLKPDVKWLTTVGFECINATKRASYAAWLNDCIAQDSKEILLRADAIISSIPSTRDIPDLGFHHRNPLMSVLESMWREGAIKSDQDIDLVMSAINSEKEILGVEHYSTIQILLILFIRVKNNQAERNEVSWLNSCIPDGFQSSLIVAWRNSSADLGAEISFNTNTVKWYSKHYEPVFSWLNEHLAVAARAGKFEFEVGMSFEDEEWFIYSNEETLDRCTACSPLLLIDEIKHRGFDAEFLMWDGSDFVSYDAKPTLSIPLDCDYDYDFVLRINWLRKLPQIGNKSTIETFISLL